MREGYQFIVMFCCNEGMRRITAKVQVPVVLSKKKIN
jgi:hypothetical protein